MKGEVKYYTAEEAKLLFKLLKEKGFMISKGRSTGNIWTKGYGISVAWMTKGFDGTWAIEMTV